MQPGTLSWINVMFVPPMVAFAVLCGMSTHQTPVNRVPLSEAIEAALAPARQRTRPELIIQELCVLMHSS